MKYEQTASLFFFRAKTRTGPTGRGPSRGVGRLFPAGASAARKKGFPKVLMPPLWVKKTGSLLGTGFFIIAGRQTQAVLQPSCCLCSATIISLIFMRREVLPLSFSSSFMDMDLMVS